VKRWGGGLKMERERKRKYLPSTHQSNKTDITKHVNIQKQVILQTIKTREGTQRGIALERSMVVKPLGSLNRF
jgi:hypothetical protein